MLITFDLYWFAMASYAATCAIVLIVSIGAILDYFHNEDTELERSGIIAVAVFFTLFTIGTLPFVLRYS